MNILLEAKGIEFNYSSGEKLLNHIDITLHEGEIIGLMGESGCGKTTLLYILAGIIPKVYLGQMKGNVKLLGTDMEDLRLEKIAEVLGIIFQDPDTQMFSSMIEEDIAFGPENLCLPWDEIDYRIDCALESTSLEKYRFTSSQNLSGGQNQLAALGSVLSLNPKVLLFDESMSHLDEENCRLLKMHLEKLAKQGKGIIMVEHDEENLSIAHKMIRLEDGQLYE